MLTENAGKEQYLVLECPLFGLVHFPPWEGIRTLERDWGLFGDYFGFGGRIGGGHVPEALGAVEGAG